MKKKCNIKKSVPRESNWYHETFDYLPNPLSKSAILKCRYKIYEDCPRPIALYLE